MKPEPTLCDCPCRRTGHAGPCDRPAKVTLRTPSGSFIVCAKCVACIHSLPDPGTRYVRRQVSPDSDAFSMDLDADFG